jgi:hypothetical protein
MARKCKFLLGALLVLSLLVSPIDCSLKPRAKPTSQKPVPPAKVNQKPAPPAKAPSNHTATPTPSSVTKNGSGGWLSGAGATYYGEPDGDGSDGSCCGFRVQMGWYIVDICADRIIHAGGACGYQTAVSKRPFNSMVAAGSSPLYNGGEGCGACYEVSVPHNLLAGSGHTITRPVAELSLVSCISWSIHVVVQSYLVDCF